MKQGIEWQVSSLELSKKLKELGVPQESLFVWDTVQQIVSRRSHVTDEEWYIAAFTVAELGEMLPFRYQLHTYPLVLNGKPAWDCTSNTDVEFPPMFTDTEADARVKMLIYLIENNLITL